MTVFSSRSLASLFAAMLIATGVACTSDASDDDDDDTATATAAAGTPTDAATQPQGTPTARADTPTATATAAPTDPATPTDRPVTGPFTLSLQLTGMGQGTGRPCTIRAVDQASGVEVGRAFQERITTPDFTLTMSGVATANHQYNIDIWVDTTNDGVYQAPPTKPSENTVTDRAWRVMTGSVTTDTQLNFTWSTNYVDVQWPG